MMKLRDGLIGSLSLALASEGWRGLGGGWRLFWGGVLDGWYDVWELGGANVRKFVLYYSAYHYRSTDIILTFKSFPVSQ